MALTLAQAMAQWSAENPKDPGETQVAYDARVADMGALLRDRSLREDEETTRKAKRKQFVDGMAGLRTNLMNLKDTTAFNALTAANKAEFLRRVDVDNTQALIWLGETLQDLGLFEKNGG